MNPYIIDLVNVLADVWVMFKHIADDLDQWNAMPVRGRIFINGVASMTTTDTPIPIPSEDCPAMVNWQDRLGTDVPHDKTSTTWSAEDGAGAASTAVNVVPNLDTPADDETATVSFVQSSGQFIVVATTPGAGGVTVRAESALYDIQPGAPAVGTITLEPAAT